MTHILEQQPPTHSFLLLKPAREIREGDIVIFQWEEEHPLPEACEEPHVITYASAPETPGINKYWQIIAWEK